MTHRPLALLGGTPVRSSVVPPHMTVGREEKRAVLRVLNRGYLSLFEGSWKADPPFSFRGGPEVQALESAWAKRYGVPHAIAVNSATSGLYAAIGAAGVGPGDEVIVSPYTMSAAATCALVFNAIPVFADVRPDIFSLDPASVRKRITPRTKAIVVVHLFGHPADMDSLLEIAREYRLVVIEDCAQAHGALYKGRPVGTLGDMGVFSLNVNKTIQCGEGGVITTKSDDLALKCQLIRNHAETVVGQMSTPSLINMLGFNFRMTELEAAVAREQLNKLNTLNSVRLELSDYLGEKLKGYPALTPPIVLPDCRHTFYVYPLLFDAGKAGFTREVFIEAMGKEGIGLYGGYVRPLYRQPLYQEKTLYGDLGCPFSCAFYKGQVDYRDGLCPVTEDLYENRLLTCEMVRAPLQKKDMDDIAESVDKVFSQSGALRAYVDARSRTEELS